MRTAISLCRKLERASSRLATFAHAISRTSPTTPIRISSGSPNPSRRVEAPWLPATSAMCWFRKSFWFSFDTPEPSCDWRYCWKVSSVLALACATVTPGFSRPITCSHIVFSIGFFSVESQSSPGNTSACMVNGTQTSGAKPTVSPKKRGGVTPMISKVVWRMRRRVPRTEGLPAKRLCQKL